MNASRSAIDGLADGPVMTEHDIRDMLTARIEKAGTKKKVADEIGITTMHLHDVLHGRRGVGSKVAKGLGLKRVVVFVKGE